MRTCRRAFLAVLATLVLFPGISLARLPQRQGNAQKVLMNQDVLAMLKSGLPAEIVAAKIKASHCDFNTDVATLKNLKQVGVPDSVVLAMVEAPHFTPMPSDGKMRVFVTDSESWQVRGGWGASNGAAGGAESGGARPQTAEIIKTFSQRCPEIVVTDKQAMANYAVTLDHEGGKGYLRKDNKIAVFRRNGDSILSESTRELGNAVKDACRAIQADASTTSAATK
jgi:hypothetical protein